MMSRDRGTGRDEREAEAPSTMQMWETAPFQSQSTKGRDGAAGTGQAGEARRRGPSRMLCTRSAASATILV